MAEKGAIHKLYAIESLIFPMIESRKANKKLRAKLTDESGILAYVENADKVTVEHLKEQYDDTVHIKDKLEDKAKTNVMGITIAVTLIMGASNMMNAIIKKCPIVVFELIAFALLIGSVAYLIFAGMLSTKVLVAENVLYIVDFSNLVDGDEELKLDYDKKIAQNRTQNTIRNNYIYASYGCVRNALICLFIVFLASTIPINVPSISTERSERGCPYNIVYSSNSIDHLGNIAAKDNIESLVLDAIGNYPPENLGNTVGIIDNTNNLFIQYTIAEDTVTINLIEPYLTP